jgi:radical SAM protein with 4Fe4S-binding SPASM domain
MNVFTLTFLGGEPLLRPDILELIALGAQNGMRTMITTNGYIVDAAYAKRLKEAGLTEVQISLDGVKAATHDGFRQLPGLYDRVIEAVHHCQNEALEVVLLTTIVNQNRDEITDVMQLTADLGVPRLNLMNLQRVGRAKKSPGLEPSKEEYVELLTQIYEKSQELPELYTFYPGLPAAMYHEAIGIQAYKELERAGKIGSCLAGITHCTISPTGDVKPCGLSEDISLGNIFHEPFSKIWKEAPVFKHLRSFSKQEWEPCSQCRFVTVCKTGCKALPQLVDDPDHWKNPDPICVECFEMYGGTFHG